MDNTLSQLESKRDHLLQQLRRCGDMRKGSITETFRRCGKKSCWCHQQGQSGHGPFYAYTTKVNGKTQTVQLRPGPLLNQYQAQVQAYRDFRRLCEELLEINESLCQLRIHTEEERQEDPKKKLYRSSKRKSARSCSS
jgi:hypothetical protein